MASSEYYHRQADFCVRMALSASIHEESVRLLDRANEYRDRATQTESLVSASLPQSRKLQRCKA
jgi:hypothetical protein